MPYRDDDWTARQIARGKRRKAGDRSARLATALMKLPAPALKKLELDEELRETIERARAVTAHIARRRAERTLAGELRRIDLAELAEQFARLDQAGRTDAQQLHLAETWRARSASASIERLEISCSPILISNSKAYTAVTSLPIYRCWLGRVRFGARQITRLAQPLHGHPDLGRQRLRG